MTARLKEIFALQDEITMKVVTALQVKLTEGRTGSACLPKGRTTFRRT